ncbi:uncharacterized protein LOC130613622 [Hydractinia symbiolongicarpus]|uniref:uncharacterized protein LOC130613622 n=1 Tax=Hydractinia symbiolongicarpus TaxID=13093 RepID=UPI00254BAD4A|nr:uncharacterized protein LOC130613622 [Hydractinia symbiolongicarpus]
MKSAVLLCLVGVTLSFVIEKDLDVVKDEAWQIWKNSHNKKYKDLSEEHVRYAIWNDNLKRITEFNKASDNLFLRMNHFGDLTNTEFGQAMNGYYSHRTHSNGSTFLAPSHTQVPDTVDWRDKGYVTPVKNQAQCGSCWAFSTTGSLEGQHFKKTGKLVSLSEQQLVDCSTSFGNHGCQGGLMDNAFKYIKSNGGIDTESSYPYEGRNDKCRFKSSDVGATDTGFVDIASGDENALKTAVATVGPISVAIDASHFSFQFYHSGVYDESSCSSTALDHGVLAVGYGTYQGKDYWLVKNSWGTGWGLKGYIRMSRNKDNQCGIASQASYPLKPETTSLYILRSTFSWKKYHYKKMQSIVLLCLIGVVFSFIIERDVEVIKDEAWQIWKSSHNRQYKDIGQERVRYEIWRDNLKRITEFNSASTNLFLRMNIFGDWTNTEYRQTMNGYFQRSANSSGSTFLPPSHTQIPDTVDWRDQGYVTPVKNQGQCGSCWAFSTTGSLEGQHFKKTGTLVNLSEQQLVDCSTSFGNHGCQGGLMDNAFKYIKSNGGIDTEDSYSYQGTQGDCRFKSSDVGATDTGFVDVTEGDENALKTAVATVGPISVAIDASHFSFQFYHSGVYDESSCSSTALDHGVLVVGYGTYQGKDYWLVKNSWGTGWGLKGYIRMSRNKDNQCGIASKASYPLV